MKKGIPTHTFFRVVFFRHKGSLTICEVSRRVLRDAFLAVVTPGHYPLLPSFFLIPDLLAVEGKKKSRQLGSHLRKEAERIPAAKPRKKGVLPTTTSWLVGPEGGREFFEKKNLSPSYPTFFMPRGPPEGYPFCYVIDPANFTHSTPRRYVSTSRDKPRTT